MLMPPNKRIDIHDVDQIRSMVRKHISEYVDLPLEPKYANKMQKGMGALKHTIRQVYPEFLELFNLRLLVDAKVPPEGVNPLGWDAEVHIRPGKLDMIRIIVRAEPRLMDAVSSCEVDGEVASGDAGATLVYVRVVFNDGKQESCWGHYTLDCVRYLTELARDRGVLKALPNHKIYSTQIKAAEAEQLVARATEMRKALDALVEAVTKMMESEDHDETD